MNNRLLLLLSLLCWGCTGSIRADYTLFEPYEGLVTAAVREAGLPVSYRWLPMLLTDCDTNYANPYTSGMWALSVPAAHRYGLLVNDSIDERRHDVASTVCATAYLKDLRDHFGGNDTLVLRQYALCVPVLRVGVDSLLWALERMEREYVSGKHISGFLVPMEQVQADAARRDSLLQQERERRAAEIAARKAKAAAQPSYIIYKVRSGDYLGRIAQRHHVTVSQLKRWNNLKSDSIREGQKLKIYKS